MSKVSEESIGKASEESSTPSPSESALFGSDPAAFSCSLFRPSSSESISESEATSITTEADSVFPESVVTVKSKEADSSDSEIALISAEHKMSSHEQSLTTARLVVLEISQDLIGSCSFWVARITVVGEVEETRGA